MLSDFTSVYEFLGGIAIACIGFKDFRKLFADYVHKKFSSLYLNVGDYLTELDEANLVLTDFEKSIEGKETIKALIANVLKEEHRKRSYIRRFLSRNMFRDNESEIKVLEKNFINACVLSILFAFTFLVSAGLEKHFSKELLIFILTNFIGLILLLCLTYPILNLNSYIRNKTCGKREFDMVFWFLLFMTISLGYSCIIECQYGKIPYRIPDLVFVSATFFVCLFSIVSLFYRYFYYLLIKNIALKIFIKKLNRTVLSQKSETEY